jgi:hypothetical protein
MTVKITVNGKTMLAQDGCNIRIGNGNVFSNGSIIISDIGNNDVTIEGNCGKLDCCGSASINGNVNGDVDCGGSCNCKDVSGNVDAGGSVTAHNISGNIDAGGSVRINKN